LTSLVHTENLPLKTGWIAFQCRW